MAFGSNGSVSGNTALSVLLGCLMMGVLIGLSPMSPIARATIPHPTTATAGGVRTTSPNLREGAPAVPAAIVVAPIEETVAAPAQDEPAAIVESVVADASNDKSGINWPTARKMDEAAEEGDGFAEGQGAWGPDNEEMEDWVDLWGGVDLVGAVIDTDVLTDEDFSFSYDLE